ncbi:methyltransferase-like protein 7A [Nephila pilipes]|uniref:Methyltransferase-like protein 7A n=1 Tax=Nephila pilipes TaxID=299642 RepID=A0A8X6P6Y7_NEPPI|nr:methyltransferase-like protein 7A [Nephila pilipes]
MIQLFWIVVCILLWIFFLTIALPITITLQLSQTFRAFFFPYAYLYLIFPLLESQAVSVRKKTFELLKDSLVGRDHSKPLEALEIGIGGGANLHHYPDNCNLTVLDKNKFFEPHFKQNAKNYPHINYKKTVIQPAENMTEIQDNSMDIVVTTYFLCSCDNSDEVLKEIIRVLKPEGKYVCMEHDSFPENTIGLYVQRFLSPLTYLYANGCNPCTQPAKVIKRAGFSQVICKECILTHWTIYPIKHHLVALATK